MSDFSPNQSAGTSRCVGWWEQDFYGRQPMEDLQLCIAGNRIWGKGTDVIADFTFEGKLREDGMVELIKQYLDQHSVVYVGQYDGEGTLAGTWDINGYRGKWHIKFLGPSHGKKPEITEILPEPK